MRRSNFVVPIVAVCVSACGAGAVPAEEVSEANAAIRAAEELGAEQHPQAALHLKMARDELANAKQFLEDDEREAAVMALDRAEIDAELALAMARAEDMQQQAQRALNEIDELKESAGEGTAVGATAEGGES